MEQKIREYLKREGWVWEEWQELEGLLSIPGISRNILGVSAEELYKIFLEDYDEEKDRGGIYQSQFGWWYVVAEVETVDGKRLPAQLSFYEDDNGEVGFLGLRVGREYLV